MARINALKKRLVELEAENASLRAELTRLKSGPAKAAPKAEK